MKKNILNLGLIAAVALAFGMSSCGSNSLQPDAKYIAVKGEGENLWGVADLKGKTVIAGEFKNEPSFVSPDMFVVREGSSLTVYKVSEKPKAVIEDIKSCGAFLDNDLMPVVKKGKPISLVDKSGNEKCALEKKYKASAPCFTDGLLWVANEDGEWGAVNTKGELVIKCKYNNVSQFIDGKALVSVRSDGEETYYIINKKGEDVLKIKDSYEPIAYDEYGLLVREAEGGRFGFMDMNGEVTKLPEKVKRVRDYNKKYVVYSDGEGVGVMTRNGEDKIRAKYDGITMLEEGSKYLVEIDDKYKIVNKDDEEQVSLSDYKSINVINPNNPVLIAKEGKEYMVLDVKGKKRSETVFKDWDFGYHGSTVYSDADGDGDE